MLCKIIQHTFQRPKNYHIFICVVVSSKFYIAFVVVPAVSSRRKSLTWSKKLTISAEQNYAFILNGKLEIYSSVETRWKRWQSYYCFREDDDAVKINMYQLPFIESIMKSVVLWRVTASIPTLRCISGNSYRKWWLVNEDFYQSCLSSWTSNYLKLTKSV